ncbi:hypothetical protein G7068_01885 [Leucobacter viscericola]|uniref:Uncharacterized protein n=1 Tax=Leucobacter viscericola TaxID=2714935 RepID=A0A6G7XCB9_9MICO|nr:hypothetical protein [Leucobacter viscericola]QIK62089.1 hypothetical protein G7068_01885 [Leucobacter viscericola]
MKLEPGTPIGIEELEGLEAQEVAGTSSKEVLIGSSLGVATLAIFVGLGVLLVVFGIPSLYMLFIYACMSGIIG